MLTTIQAADILGVQPTSVRVWLNEEGHPRFPNAQKFGRDWQIPESDLASHPKGRKRGRPAKKKADDGAVIETSTIEATPARAEKLSKKTNGKALKKKWSTTK